MPPYTRPLLAKSIMQILHTPRPEDTAAAAAALVPHLRPGLCITLSGEPGAGKTCFAGGLIAAAAARCGFQSGSVTSPTFSLMNFYPLTPVPIAHGDAYRIAAPEAFVETGIEDRLHDHCVLIEWPENIEALLPPQRLALRLHQGTIALQSHSTHAELFEAMFTKETLPCPPFN